MQTHRPPSRSPRRRPSRSGRHARAAPHRRRPGRATLGRADGRRRPCMERSTPPMPRSTCSTSCGEASRKIGSRLSVPAARRPPQGGGWPEGDASAREIAHHRASQRVVRAVPDASRARDPVAAIVAARWTADGMPVFAGLAVEQGVHTAEFSKHVQTVAAAPACRGERHPPLPSRRVRLRPPCRGQRQRHVRAARRALPSAWAISAAIMALHPAYARCVAHQVGEVSVWQRLLRNAAQVEH